ncbi:transient receptor potential cation channel subfamily V member 6-like isoform X2 [Ornithorhynchus anatinus]|uniref:transient receptor potential cation channel subfamily V member 6-like isoform X2 n=1 Tax=Ornithorhynchus anatinus TaxID=9258 RepID=UPI0010A84402|nr:transient receptor potential cation channel subfamily V member 6-like isoform X2 [Ornithorhynchus anatinus]
MHLTVSMDESLRDISQLFKAARMNDFFTMQALLQKGDIDSFVRGGCGETILHAALLSGSKEVVEVILDEVPSLINEPVTSNTYRGETSMHIPALTQDHKDVKEFLRCGANVTELQATETWFIPGKESKCYFACVGHEAILRLLMEHNAPLEAQDSLGNTVLHVLVLQPNKELAHHMYNLIVNLVPEKHCWFVESLQNSDGFTPLKLAAHEGNLDMFSYLVQRQKNIYWTMGTISYCTYDLTCIDSWEDQSSVLDIITSSKNQQVRKLIDATPIKELLNEKWKCFGYRHFLVWLCSYILYIVIFTLSCLYRPLQMIPPGEGNNITAMTHKSLKESYVTKDDFLRLVGELITILGAIGILINELPYLCRIGPRNYIGNAAIGGPFSLLMMVYSILIFAAAILRVLGHSWETIPLSIALIIGWCNLIYFARGFKMLGQFSIMIQKIIFGDLLPWCFLLFLIMIGFSSAFYILFQTLDLRTYSAFQNYPDTLYTSVELMMGLIAFPVPVDVPPPPMIYIIYIFYMVFAYLLMLNLLIAMIDDTYWRVAQEREELWKVQVAATILVLERRAPRCFKTRSGIPGNALGYDDNKWYLGVEEISNETQDLQKSLQLE